MLSSIFLINKDGIIIIEKQYKEKVPRSEIDAACLAIQTQGSDTPAILESNDFTIFLHQERDIWVCGVCEGDEFATFGVALVQHVGKLLENILKNGATEGSIKDEYPTVYQILDLAIDYGFPFLDENNAITTVLNRPPVDPKVRGSGRINFDLERPWRETGCKYMSHEVLVDVYETVDVVVSSHGRTEFCHIRGSIEVTSKLSGSPTCKLVLMPSVRYEDVCFHRCCDVESPEAKVIPFVPPEGKFTLLKYRLTATQSTLPLWLVPKFSWTKGSVSFEIALKPDAKNPKALDDIEISFEFPDGVLSPTLTVPIGRAVYDSKSRLVSWTIPSYAKKDTVMLKGSASTEPGFDLGGRFPVVCAKFQTTGAIPSGFKIDHLDIEGVERLFKGVKYIAKAGNYEFRTGLC